MFAPFSLPSGEVSPDALLEQSVMEGAIYWNRRDIALETISIAGGGQLLAWEFDDNTWPPSYVLWRQGNNLYVAVTGTHNLPQLYGDIVGAFAGAYPGFECQAHTFFLESWHNLRGRLALNLPADYRTCNMHFVGHSLGAAVAFLGACAWQNDLPDTWVEYLGLAQPKALTSGYNGRTPGFCYNIANVDDVVPLLPMNRGGLGLELTPLTWALGLPNDWTAYRNHYTMDFQGTLTRQLATYFEALPGPRIIGTTPAAHPIAAYMQRINALWLRDVRIGQNLPLIGLSQTIQGLPAPQNGDVNINADATINIAAANQINFNSPGPGPLTPANLDRVNNLNGRLLGVERGNPIFTRPITFGGGSMPSKITFFYSVNKAGFSESFYDSVRGPEALTAAVLSPWVTARMGLCGNETRLDYVRLSTVGDARKVAILYPKDFGDAVPVIGNYRRRAAGAASDFGGTALLVRKYQGLAFSRIFVRGIPDEIVDGGGNYAPTAGFSVNFDAFNAATVAMAWSWRGVSGNVNPPAAITNITQNADVTCTYTLGTNLFQGVPILTHAVVRVNGQKNPKQVNGTQTVVVTGANTCISLRELPVVGFVAGGGKMTYSSLTYKPITKLSVERVVSKRPGAPFGLYRGRSKKASLV